MIVGYDSAKNFERWLSRLYEIMIPDLEGADPKTYCDPEDWREFFEYGDSPEEAWSTEKSYWEE